MKDVMLAISQWTLLIAIRLPLILIGFFVVAVALLSKPENNDHLPKWAWLWDNDIDGVTGNAWWAKNTPFPPVWSFLSMWWWTAVRNPVNNLRFVPGISCPVSECLISYRGSRVVEDKPKLSGWQFVKAERIDGISVWYGFYFVHAWSDTRAFVIRLGYKIKPDHAGRRDEPSKGMTFKINPWKSI